MDMELFDGLVGKLKSDRNRIIQFSPPRSGSTLVYNILLDIFPNREIIKKHNLGKEKKRIPIVATYRHPLDCIASSIQRYDLPATEEVIDDQIREFEENGIWDVLDIKDNSNVLMLRYEDFYDDHEMIIDKIATFFQIEISSRTKEEIIDKYQIDKVEEKTSEYKDFKEYDEETHWHGNHISKYKGKPYYYRYFFEKKQIKYLMVVFKDYIKAFGYTN